MKFEAKSMFLTAALAALILPAAAQNGTAPQTTGGNGVQAQPTTEVGKRQENEGDRIANGQASGKLDSQQAARLDNKSDKIQNEINRDRANNGGKLTPQEKQRINRQQNHVSHKMQQVEHH
jgi:hypothetical protein